MIAWINGVMVQGSPEEIERYKAISSPTKTSTKLFNIRESDVPDHIKKYGDNQGWHSKDNTVRAWY